MNGRPIKICFVSVHAYPVINPDAPGMFGGMETISWDFARGVAALPDTDVSFVVTHRKAPRRSRVDEVTVVEATDQFDWYHQDLSRARREWHEDHKIPWTRLGPLAAKLVTHIVTRPFRAGSHLRWLTTSRRLTEINADIYVAFGVNAQADWTEISARSIRRPTVICLMSDFDADRQFHDNPEFVNQYGVTSKIVQRLLRDCDGLVAQTPRQQRQLKEVWQRDSTIVSNPLDLATWDADRELPPPDETPKEPFALWVGRADRFHKRPLLMLPAIRMYPQIRFVMVLNPSDDEVLTQIKNERLENLTMISQVSSRRMAALMNAACVFVTSSSPAFEGLPSVLLQAAAARIPILSLDASAEWLKASGAGICFNGNQPAFAREIDRFVTERETAEIKHYAESGRRFVEREHDIRQQSSKLLEYLHKVRHSHE